MKFKNKKTGQEGNFIVNKDHFECVDLEYVPEYRSLAELNADWEDVEPLIKDDKIRKAVRAWAEANDIERVWHEYSTCWLRGNGLSIELENEVVDLKQGNFAIAELCGEEE